MNMISVVIPLYNKADMIERTLRSILKQSFSDFEIIIADDGSTDNSLEIVSKIRDLRIKIFKQENQGVSAARNFGIKMASYDLIAFIDADDEWDADYLESAVDLIRKFPEADVFATNYRFCDSKGNISNTIIQNLPFDAKCGLLSNYFEVARTSHPPVCSSAVIIKKNAIESIGGFPIGISSGEDLLTWTRLAVKYQVAYNSRVLVTYNIGESFDYAQLPPRRQDTGDPVGKILKEIYHKNKKIAGLRKYLAHWHKMRASVAIRYGERAETLKEVAKSLFYNPTNFKVIPFAALALVPSNLRKRIISGYRK